MKLNRLEIAGIIASLALVLLAAVFCITQTAYAQDIDPCAVPGMVMFGCDEEGDMGVPVDPCDITPCDEGNSLAEQINCEIYHRLMAAGDPIPQGFDASGCGGDGGGETQTDVCPDDEGVQTDTPCSSDGDEEEGGGGGDGNNDSGSGSGSGSGGGSNGGGSGGGGSGGSGGGSVLGATSPLSCHEYLTGFVKQGSANDFEQVARLQAFLKVFEGANVEINGAYDAASVAAVHAFQLKYSADVLTPWDISHSTGYVYLTTRKKINEIYCDRGMTFPLTASEQQIIESTKAAANVADVHVHEEAPVIEEEPVADEPQEDSEDEVVDRPGNAITNFFRRVLDWFR